MLVIFIIQFPKERSYPHPYIGPNIFKRTVTIVGRRAEKSCYNTHFRDIKIRCSHTDNTTTQEH